MLPNGLRVLPGKAFPLGATVTESGVNFAVVSHQATQIHLCLFDAATELEAGRIPLPTRTGHIWHGLIEGLAAGQLYGYRAEGEYDPPRGLRFNPTRLLIDPYAKAIAGEVDWRAALRGESQTQRPELRDDAFGVPKSIVYGDGFDWQGDTPPRIPLHESLIYEAHVKGFSYRNPAVPPEHRGTFLGLASDASIDHLHRLGVTAVELLPVHAHADRESQVRRGLVNYWGYDSIGFFAPDARFSASGDRGGQVHDFKTMVRELHRNGIEVILDVVYNHTAEGDETGPTLMFRGLDNAAYYSLRYDDASRYVNYTGTGNTVRTTNPDTLRLIMDSLRYWVTEMHVDGFRFDLAAALVDDGSDGHRRSAFLEAVHQDPVLANVKLIAEPWHLGPGGYMVGSFPVPWSEWNDRFRDTVRHYWHGHDGKTSDLAYRLTGSSDLHARDGHTPQSSINFITSHDGFTLHDLVSYNTKHNLDNGEGNRDGADHNISWNHGIEGPTNDPSIRALREQQKRNFLATLFFSQGVPMLLGGDEIGRTQRGNNNAYAQDNEVSWYDWRLDATKQDLLDFTARLSALRRKHPSLGRRGFLHGQPNNGSSEKDVLWLLPNGREMTAADWQAPGLRCFGMRLDGHIDDVDDDGVPLRDDSLLILLNTSQVDVGFVLPDGAWTLEIDTARPGAADGSERHEGGESITLAARSLRLLREDAGTI